MEIIVLLAGIAVIALLYISGERLRIMPVPTLPKARRDALSLMPADARFIFELGSGWGGMTRRLRRRYPQARIIAYERSLIPYAVSRLFGPVRREDLFTADLTNADIVFCYLSPWHMERLAPKFEAELKDGACVISVAFPLPRQADDQKGRAYLYRYRK